MIGDSCRGKGAVEKEKVREREEPVGWSCTARRNRLYWKLFFASKISGSWLARAVCASSSTGLRLDRAVGT